LWNGSSFSFPCRLPSIIATKPASPLQKLLIFRALGLKRLRQPVAIFTNCVNLLHWKGLNPPPMPYQYKREPLTQDEANRLANACQTHAEKLVVWTLLDTGLRVSELATLSKDQIDWQGHRLTIYGKGGPYGSSSKRRVLPLSSRVQPLLEGHFALHDTLGMSPRTIQRLMKEIANKAHIARTVTPHVLRHTFSVTAVQKGISLPVLQRLLGHDHLTTTQIYLNLSPEDVIREFREKW